MNTRSGCIVLVFALNIQCLLAVLFCALDRQTGGWLWFFVALEIFLAGGMLLVWRWPDPSPDALRTSGAKVLERDGLCFSLRPEFIDGRPHLTVTFQNRYESPCEAKFLIRAIVMSRMVKLVPLEISVSCPGQGGQGQRTVSWPIPPPFWKERLLIRVGVDTHYPHGKGEMVRFHQGLEVSPFRSLAGELSGMMLTYPGDHEVDLAECPHQGKARSSIVHPASDDPLDAESSAESSRTDSPVPPGPNADRSKAAGPLEPAALERLLSSLTTDPGLIRLIGTLDRLKRDRLKSTLRLGCVSMLISLLVGAYGSDGFRIRWPNSSLKEVLVLFGGFLFIFALSQVVDALSSLWYFRSIEPADSLEEACAGFYLAALLKFESEFTGSEEILRLFPVPIIQSYLAKPSSFGDLMERWVALRRRHYGIESGLEVDQVVVVRTNRADARLVDIVVEVIVKSSQRLRFRNVAFHVENKWFLATPEPLNNFLHVQESRHGADESASSQQGGDVSGLSRTVSHESAEPMVSQDQNHISEAPPGALSTLKSPIEMWQTWNDQGNRLADQGDYGEALSAYEEALALDSNNAVIWVNRGRALAELGKFEEAFDCYSEATALDSTLEIGAEYGKTKMLMGEYAEALQLLDTALVRAPDSTDILYQRSLCLLRLGKPELALQGFEQLVAKDPYCFDASRMRIDALVALGRGEEAKSAMALLLSSHHPKNLAGRLRKGMDALEFGFAGIARSVFCELLERDPRHSEARRGLGNALSALHRFQESQEVLERGLEISPGDPDLLRDHVSILTDAWRHDLERGERSLLTETRRGAILRGFRKWRERAPRIGQVWLAQGAFHLLDGDKDRASACFEEAARFGERDAGLSFESDRDGAPT